MKKEQVKIILNEILEKDNIDGVDIIGDWQYSLLLENMLEKPKFIYDDSILVIYEKKCIYYFEVEKISFIVAILKSDDDGINITYGI